MMLYTGLRLHHAGVSRPDTETKVVDVCYLLHVNLLTCLHKNFCLMWLGIVPSYRLLLETYYILELS